MVRRDTRLVGNDAENLAFRFLQQHGLIPIRRNFRCRLGELDLIMLDQRCLVVIEVRYRGDTSLVPAGLSIDRRKQQKIIRTAALFLAWNQDFATCPMRFDVVAVNSNAAGELTVEWIQDAFRPANARL